MQQFTANKTSILKKISRYVKGVAIFILAFNALTSLGALLGIWSTPAKSGLLPYEAPTMTSFKEVFIKEAFAS